MNRGIANFLTSLSGKVDTIAVPLVMFFDASLLSLLVASMLFGGHPFCFQARDLTFPGASHLSRVGFTSLYPGHCVPDTVHLLHVGCVRSQTRHRLRHSQQCRIWGSPISSRPRAMDIILKRLDLGWGGWYSSCKNTSVVRAIFSRRQL